MKRTIPRTADIDIDILREMYRSNVVTIAGIDPRLNASRIAQRLRISRARVRARLAEWTHFGLIQRYDVWPNPALVGRTGFTVDVRLADRFAKEEFYQRLGLIEGVLGALDFRGDWLAAQFLVERGAEIPRVAGLLRALAGVAEVGEPIPWAELPARRPLSPLDLRIVRALRERPRDSLSEIARKVGISSRTMTSRYGALVEELAVWFVPVFDFRAIAQPVVSLSVQLTSESDRAEIGRALHRAYPMTLEFGWAGFGPVPARDFGVYFVLPPSAAAIEELEAFVAGLPGVRGLEALIMQRMVSYARTFDRLLEAATPTPARRAR